MPHDRGSMDRMRPRVHPGYAVSHAAGPPPVLSGVYGGAAAKVSEEGQLAARRHSVRFSMTRAVRGSDGWKWMSSIPSSGSPGSRDR